MSVFFRAIIFVFSMTAVALAAPTLHLIGDSTMADKPKEPANPETGWGQVN
jgi:hypothetical protein